MTMAKPPRPCPELILASGVRSLPKPRMLGQGWVSTKSSATWDSALPALSGAGAGRKRKREPETLDCGEEETDPLQHIVQIRWKTRVTRVRERDRQREIEGRVGTSTALTANSMLARTNTGRKRIGGSDTASCSALIEACAYRPSPWSGIAVPLSVCLSVEQAFDLALSLAFLSLLSFLILLCSVEDKSRQMHFFSPLAVISEEREGICSAADSL